MAPARLTISDVHKATGIPVTTLRFYEKELPDFFTVEKTAGGHRRYTEESVRQFAMVRKMVDSDGVKLGDLRNKLIPKPDGSEVRRHVDLLLSVYEEMTAEIERLKVRVESLEILQAAKRPAAAPASPQPAPKKGRWF